MFAAIRRRATYANVVATIALILAVGGGSAYALQGRNTVFSDDIARNQVKGADIDKRAIAPSHLKKSAKKVFGYVRRISPTITLPSSGSDEAVAECPNGKVAVGGGFWRSAIDVEIYTSRPYNDSSWQVYAMNPSGSDREIAAYVVCVNG